MKKRLTALLTAICMTCFCFPLGNTLTNDKETSSITASASGFSPASELNCEKDNITWNLDETTGILTVSGIGPIDCRPWFNDTDRIKGVIISEGITRIGSCAFYGCTRMKSAVLPDSLKVIGDHAFDGCNALEQFNLPDGLMQIEEHAFSGCISLPSVKIPSGVTEIGDWAFAYCEKLTAVEIPESIMEIGMGAFSESPWLDALKKEAPLVVVNHILIDGSTCSGDVVIPVGVTCIAGEAFYRNEDITSVTIPGTVTNIGWNAFAECSSLVSVIIQDGVRCIEHGAFWRCTSLTDIQFPDSIESIDKSAFQEVPWLKARIAEDPMVIISSILVDGRECTGKVVVPDGVTDIAPSAFDGNQNLTGIVLPESVTDLREYAFASCQNLTDIVLSEELSTIENGAFTGCKGISDITFPDSLSYIGDYAFSGCDGLTEATLPENVFWIGEGAFEGCHNLTNIKLPKSNRSFLTVDGVLFSKDKTRLLCYPAGKQEKYYVIPDSVTEIGNRAFGCDSLKAIGFPEKLQHIGEFAFSYCNNLESVTLPESVDYIGYKAFSECDRLTTVRLPQNVRTICDACFSDCKNLKSVTIPEGITNISDFMFSDCPNLYEVALPDTLKVIGYGAFRDCHALYDIAIPDSIQCIGAFAFDDTLWLDVQRKDDPFVVVNGILLNASRCKGNVTIPAGVKEINDCAFSDGYTGGEQERTMITSVIIPEGVQRIKTDIFCDVKDLKYVTIPQSVTRIEPNAIYSYEEDPVTIRGFASSFAEAYAKEQNIRFEAITSLDELPDDLPDDPVESAPAVSLKDAIIPAGGTTSIIADVQPGTYQNDQGEDVPYQTGFIYHSSDNSVAIAEPDGTIYAVHPGKAKIYVECIEGKEPVYLQGTESYHVLMIDRSLDMGEEVFRDAKSAVLRYCETTLKQFPEDKIAVIAVGDEETTKIVCPWTNDLSELQKAVSNISVGGTSSYSAAFKSANSLLEELPMEKRNCNQNLILFGNGIDKSESSNSLRYVGSDRIYFNASLNIYSFAFYGDHLTAKEQETGTYFLQSVSRLRLVDSENHTIGTVDRYFEEPDAETLSHAIHAIINRPAIQKNVEQSEMYVLDVYVYEETQKAQISLGDVTGDSIINAKDANAILIAAAKIGTGNTSGLTPELEKSADVNGDGAINAKDANTVLRYAAAVGTGQKVSITDFI